MARRKQNYPLIEGLEITTLAAEGKAMGRWQDQVVFVPMTVPGDVVDVQIPNRRRRFMEGTVVRYVHRSPLRVEPFCAHFGVCGGCKWQNLPYAEQLRFKTEQVRDQLARIGKIELPAVRPCLAPNLPKGADFMSCTVRPAATGDLPALAALERECFSHPWSENSLAETLQNGRSIFLLAEREGEPLGYLGMEYVLDEGSITNVAVFAAHRRQGIADALIKELLHYAAALELSTVTLEVRETNAPAIALYQKHDFVPVGRRKNYYTSPTEDAILMTHTCFITASPAIK